MRLFELKLTKIYFKEKVVIMGKKSIAIILMTLMLTGVMSGCSDSAKKTSSDTANSSDSMESDTIISRNVGKTSGNTSTLNVSYFLGGAGDGWFKYLKSEFESKNPGVTVALDGSATIGETIPPRVEANIDVPDVMFLGNEDLWRKWGMSKTLVDLSDVYTQTVPGTTMTLENYIIDSQRPQYNFQYQGKTMKVIVPWMDAVSGIVYNKKMFEKNGWVFPKTWVEFEALCEKIKAKGIAPLTYPGLYSGYNSIAIMPFIAQELGAVKYKEFMNPTSSAIFGDVGIRTAWQKYESWFTKGWILSGTQALNHIQSQMEFLNGNAAMIVNGPWLETEMKSSIPAGFEMVMAAIPAAGALGMRAANRGSSDWVGIPAKSQNIEMAKKFILFSCSPEACIKFFELSGMLRPFKVDYSSAKKTVFQQSVIDLLNDKTVFNSTVASQGPLTIPISTGAAAYADISTGKLTANQFFEIFKKQATILYESRKKDLGLS